ncbi:hypothetical protein [Mycoplasma phocoenae]|uniref:Uncharacterized protein n=1 Tax=Mycoplasma phocoenae TaxID=754517 RepID=A0A858U3C7_9MOLU|nr:hypothetical protein [Mycoplasma phocoenae]QJG66922.1 hypothetical protein HGG69_01105 [Mycoplasma phocoenae]
MRRLIAKTLDWISRYKKYLFIFIVIVFGLAMTAATIYGLIMLPINWD